MQEFSPYKGATENFTLRVLSLTDSIKIAIKEISIRNNKHLASYHL